MSDPELALHGIFLGEERRGLVMVYVYAHGEMVRREPVRVDQVDDECEELECWLDRKHSERALLRLVRP
jgi:hypothetical protein